MHNHHIQFLIQLLVLYIIFIVIGDMVILDRQIYMS